MAAKKDEDWENVIDTTYDVVEDQLARSQAFDRTLARTIGVAGLYEVYLWLLCKMSYYRIFLIVNIKYEILFMLVLGLARPWEFVHGSIWQGKVIVNLSSIFIAKINLYFDDIFLYFLQNLR